MLPPTTSIADSPDAAAGRGAAVRVFLTCWLVFVAHFATNTVRELYPALSLGDHLSFDVREYAGLHPDIFERPDGSAFINNNPGASILAAVPYVLARPAIDRVVARVRAQRAASGASEPPPYDSPWPMAREFYRKAYERGLDIKFGLAAAVVQALLMAPLSALSATVMFSVLARRTLSWRPAALLALLYAFATPVLYRTAQLNQNLLVAHAAFFAFVLLWRPWDRPGAPRRPWYLLAGLLAGWSVACDYSGVVVAGALFLYAIVRRRGLPRSVRAASDLPLLLLGMAVAGAVLAAYQWSSFGHPLYPAQHYMPAATYTHLGYVGMSRPQMDLLWDTLFGTRFGLFTSAPLLLLALWPAAWRKGMRLVGGREAAFCGLFAVAFVLFCAANQYGRMQFNTGVRHVVPVVPFLFLIACGPLLAWPRVAVGLFALAATYWSWCLAMYRDVEGPLGVLEPVWNVTFGGFRLPWLTTLERLGGQFPAIAGSGVSAAPVLVLLGGAVALLWILRGSGQGTANTPGR
ncbi:MAG: hypothetical protein HY763_14075 [Planctomycetes bacterium]|nr:hypothetical protein [Planctomycetota bacterium]